MSTRGNVLLPTLKPTGELPFIFPIPALHESLTVVPLHLRREGNWRLFWQHPFQGGFPMSTKAAEHHEQTVPRLTLLVKSPLHRAPSGVTRDGVRAAQSVPA